MNNLEAYKKIIEVFNVFNKKREEVPDVLYDECDGIWYSLSLEEREQARQYYVDIMEQWTPLEKYLQAVQVLKSFPKYHINDRTSLGERKNKKSIGKRKRKKIFPY